MKKRSLVAAIAMLIVSAIVLTSSTYAWFATNSSASVDTMSANVANNDGSLQIRAAEGAAGTARWKTSLTSADYTGIPNNLNPVSMAMVSGAPSFYIAAYDGTKFTATGSGNASVNSDYIKYGFDVQYVNGGATTPTITITPSWSDTSDFCYAIVKVAANSTTTYYLFDASGSYTPITAVNGDIIDNKTADTPIDVIDDGDTNGDINASKGGFTGATKWSTAGISAIEVTAAANTTTAIDVDVYIWAEGQDEDCSGTTAAGTATMSFSLGVVAQQESSSQD